MSALGLWEIIRGTVTCQETYELFRKNNVTVMGQLAVESSLTRLIEHRRGVEPVDERLLIHCDSE